MSRLRVLVVEDSITVRKRLCEELLLDPDIEVVGEAVDGRQAIEQCMALRPDVITMDMMLPIMSGLAATEYIMAHCPTPILVVSSAANRGELFRTFDALNAGAVEILEKPAGDDHSDAQWAHKLRTSVKLVARIRVITHVRAKLASAGAPVLPPASHASGLDRLPCKLIAIGASTGGPGAIVKVLCALPSPLTVPVLVVQHMSEEFGHGFADWLNTQISHPTSYAVHNEPLANIAGRIVLASPNRHLLVNQGRLQLVDEPPTHSCRPSIDRLFYSIARECAASTIACLLTGMGRDGASGLLAIRQGGGHTIAQDEATSVIYGMPREAVNLNAAVQVLPLDEIGPTLAGMLASGQRVRL